MYKYTQSNRLFQYIQPIQNPGDYVELLGQVAATSGKKYLEFRLPTPAVGYHTDTSTYSNTEYKVGFILYDTTIPRIRNAENVDAIWIEFGYEDGFGESVKKTHRPNSSEDRVAFNENTANSTISRPYDTLGIEIDIDNGTLDNFYINGSVVTMSGTAWNTVSTWEALSPVRPYAAVINRPFVAIDATIDDIVDNQELCSIKLNTTKDDCRYTPSSGYDYFDTTGGGTADVSKPFINNAYKYYLSDTATTSTTLTIPTDTIIWSTIEWVDSSSAPTFTKLGTMNITITDSDANLGYALFNAEGVCLWSTTWSGESWYIADEFKVLNGRTYYMAIGFNLVQNTVVDFDVTATGGGTYISQITVAQPA